MMNDGREDILRHCNRKIYQPRQRLPSKNQGLLLSGPLENVFLQFKVSMPYQVIPLNQLHQKIYFIADWSTMELRIPSGIIILLDFVKFCLLLG